MPEEKKDLEEKRIGGKSEIKELDLPFLSTKSLEKTT